MLEYHHFYIVELSDRVIVLLDAGSERGQRRNFRCPYQPSIRSCEVFRYPGGLAECLSEALKTGDRAFITETIGVVKRRTDTVRAHLAKADAGGPFVTDAAIDEWLRSLGIDQELPVPKATFRTS